MKSLYNLIDTECLARAIRALEYNDLTDAMTHAEHIYLVAFSIGLGTKASACECLLDFFGGESEFKEVHDKMLLSLGCEPCELMIGDLVLFGDGEKARVAIFDGEELLELGKDRAGVRVDAREIKSARLSATLRPKNALVGFVDSDPRPNELELSEAQRALVLTAEAYLARGYRCQYDDSRFTRCGGGEFRWQIGFRSPEEYTRGAFGYINCAAFTYEVYREALGMDLGSLYTTYNYMLHYKTNGFSENEPARPFYYVLTHNETKEEKNSVRDRFCAALKVGDVVVYRRNNGNGHAMLYIGGGKLIHSTGASYNYKEGRETFEPTVRYMHASGLFAAGTNRYIFAENIETLGIIRPLDLFNGEIPENTLARVNKMRGIFAEKLISRGNRYANIGDVVEYKIEIKNESPEARTVNISEVIPQNAEYVGGDLTVSGGVMSAVIEISPWERASVTYKLKAVGECGSRISGSGTFVNGVLHTCPDVIISRIMTIAEGERIKSAVKSLDFNGEADGIELANIIYEAAGVAARIEVSADIEGELFIAEEFYTLRNDGRYKRYIPENIYGGRNLQTQNLYSATCKSCSGRVRLPKVCDLVVGDVIMVKDKAGIEFYFHSGEDKLRILEGGLEFDSISIEVRLESLLGVHDYFVVLRAQF